MITALTAAALTPISGWLNTSLASLDESAAIAVHRLYELAPGFFTPFLNLISLMGKGGIFLILLSFALMLFRPTRRYGCAMLLSVAVGALITNLTVKPLVARPRPYTWDGSVYQQFWIQLGKHTESDKSFPSGHMTAAMAASTALFLKGNKKISWTAFIFAFLMGLSRIYLSVHYTSDVLGGVVTGGVGGLLGTWISGRIPEGFYNGRVSDLLPGNRGKEAGAAEEAADGRKVIVIDGKTFSTLGGFYACVSDKLGTPTGKSVRTLDALNDILRGGFGKTEAGESLHIRWLNSEKSRRDLGYEATAAYYEKLLERAHPSNRAQLEQKLSEAREGKGATLFDIVTALIRREDSGHDCTLSLE